MEQNPIREQFSPTRALNFQSLDAWRGAACLAVVFFHCREELKLHLKTMPPSFEWAQFGFLGVQIFFVISGFCIAVAAHSSWYKRNFGGFVWARLTRIYPPYWAGLALFLLLHVVASHRGAQDEVLGSSHGGSWFYGVNLLLFNGAFPQPILLRVAWSLCYEVAFYAVVFAALVGCSWAKSAHRMLDALHCVSLVCLVWLLLPQPLFAPPRFPFNMWPQFGAGILVFDLLLARAQNEGKRLQFLHAVGLAFATLSVAFLGRCALSDRSALHGYIAPFAVAFGFAAILWGVYQFEDTLNRWNFVKVLRFIGTFSYSIYLVHFTLIMALSRGLFSHFKSLPWFVEVALLFLASVGSGWCFYQMVEKPSQKLKRVGNSRKSL